MSWVGAGPPLAEAPPLAAGQLHVARSGPEYQEHRCSRLHQRKVTPLQTTWSHSSSSTFQNVNFLSMANNVWVVFFFLNNIFWFYCSLQCCGGCSLVRNLSFSNQNNLSIFLQNFKCYTSTIFKYCFTQKHGSSKYLKTITNRQPLPHKKQKNQNKTKKKKHGRWWTCSFQMKL